MVGRLRGAVVERGDRLALEGRERKNGLGVWVEEEGGGAEAVESADGMAGGGGLGLLLIFWEHEGGFSHSCLRRHTLVACGLQH